MQVDKKGNAWVAGYTTSSQLDGRTNPGNAGDCGIFLMKFDARGVHQWTRLHGGRGRDEAHALQAGRWGAMLFFLVMSCDIFDESMLQNFLRGSCWDSRGVASPFNWINPLGALTRSISHILWKFESLRDDFGQGRRFPD